MGYEKKFIRDGTVSIKWMEMGHMRGRSVARVDDADEKGHGTAWLVKASDFCPGREGLLVLTNAHIVSQKKVLDSMRPAQASASTSSAIPRGATPNTRCTTTTWSRVKITSSTTERRPNAAVPAAPPSAPPAGASWHCTTAARIRWNRFTASPTPTRPTRASRYWPYRKPRVAPSVAPSSRARRSPRRLNEVVHIV